MQTSIKQVCELACALYYFSSFIFPIPLTDIKMQILCDNNTVDVPLEATELGAHIVLTQFKW